MGRSNPTARRAVVTGLGVVSPFGVGLPPLWEGLIAGRSAVGPITLFDASAFPTRIAAEVKGFEPKAFIEDRKSLRTMRRATSFALAAARMAMEDSGVRVGTSSGGGEVEPCRLGVILGVGAIYPDPEELAPLWRLPSNGGPVALDPQGGMRHLPTVWHLMNLPNTASAHLSLAFNAQGPNSTLSTACAAGTQAIREALRVIALGEADAILAGGCDARINPLGILSFCRMGALSTRNHCPAEASRPFELHRDGFVVGEGAAILVVEEREHAQRRGARIYGELAGYGRSFDAYSLTRPQPEGRGAALAMELALQEAGLAPAEVDYINAHGTSTLLNDVAETRAIKKVLGERAYQVPISSIKSMVGHLLAAAGALEIVVSLLSLQHGLLPPTINYRDPDPECDLDYIPNRAREAKRLDVVLSNSFGFGGQNASLVIWRDEGRICDRINRMKTRNL